MRVDQQILLVSTTRHATIGGGASAAEQQLDAFDQPRNDELREEADNSRFFHDSYDNIYVKHHPTDCTLLARNTANRSTLPDQQHTKH